MRLKYINIVMVLAFLAMAGIPLVDSHARTTSGGSGSTSSAGGDGKKNCGITVNSGYTANYTEDGTSTETYNPIPANCGQATGPNGSNNVDSDGDGKKDTTARDYFCKKTKDKKNCRDDRIIVTGPHGHGVQRWCYNLKTCAAMDCPEPAAKQLDIPLEGDAAIDFLNNL